MPVVLRSHEVPDDGAITGVEFGPPEIANQHHPQRVAVVPRFVLDRVIEDPRLAFAPLTGIGANSKAAPCGHDQRQVQHRAEIGDTVVRRDVRVRREQREHQVGSQTADVGLMLTRQGRDGRGARGGIYGIDFAITDQVERIPGATGP